MRFSPNLLDEIRSRLPVSQVVGRKVALKKAGREYRGLSPFKVEKSPSFFVNDQKGFYHCFASGEHGDIFTFLMKTEGLEFPEAVERLAAEAGVAIPKQVERNVEQEDQRDRLYRLLEASAAYFENALLTSAGTEARRYLEKRGLAPETIESFRLGFAPNSRTALGAHLKTKGFSALDMASAGMLISGDDIPEPYDRFRNRVMFPILDLKGRVIAFGGRALDKDAPAKYLNSPETPLFHKGHILFNAARARTASHDKGRVIVVEGYMDVVALSEAGFGETVAPLGTALTEDQLKLLWRIAPEPVLCFDGDPAGQKAANRAVEIALPWVKPGQSVAFAFLPNGLDPDDLIRQQGASAMVDVLEKTRPLIEVLWDREVGVHPTNTPEQRAALEARLGVLTASIQDAVVRSHYARELRDRLYQLGRSRPAFRHSTSEGPAGARGQASYARPIGKADWRFRDRMRLSDGSAARRFQNRRAMEESSLVASAELVSHFQSISPREALIVKTLINHPWLIDEHSEEIADIKFAATSLSTLRDEILAIHARQNLLDSATLRTQLSKSGVAKVVDLIAQTITHASDRFAEPEATAADVEAAWHHTLALHQRLAALKRELTVAEDAWRVDCTVEASERLLELHQQIMRAEAMDQMDQQIEQPDDASEVKRAG